MNKPARDYRHFAGWYFQRHDSERIELFKIGHCAHCHAEFSQSRHMVAESNNRCLIDNGLRHAKVPELEGGQPFAGGPSLCSKCMRAWREGKLNIGGV